MLAAGGGGDDEKHPLNSGPSMILPKRKINFKMMRKERHYNPLTGEYENTEGELVNSGGKVRGYRPGHPFYDPTITRANIKRASEEKKEIVRKVLEEEPIEPNELPLVANIHKAITRKDYTNTLKIYDDKKKFFYEQYIKFGYSPEKAEQNAKEQVMSLIEKGKLPKAIKPLYNLSTAKYYGENLANKEGMPREYPENKYLSFKSPEGVKGILKNTRVKGGKRKSKNKTRKIRSKC